MILTDSPSGTRASTSTGSGRVGPRTILPGRRVGGDIGKAQQDSDRFSRSAKHRTGCSDFMKSELVVRGPDDCEDRETAERPRMATVVRYKSASGAVSKSDEPRDVTW